MTMKIVIEFYSRDVAIFDHEYTKLCCTESCKK